MASAFLLAAVLLLGPATGYAQAGADRKAPCAQVAANLSYDVVSIHPNRSGDGNWGASWGDDRYRATNVQLTQLIEQAYELREDQITGVPGSVDSVHYDIEAKALGSEPGAAVKLSDRQLRCMLIPLLADRFHLRSHTETRSLPVYELTLAKTPAKLTPAGADAEHGSMSMNWSGSVWELKAETATMEELASMLAQERQRTVIDKTGLAGRYTFSLRWLREGASDPVPDSPPRMLTALQEQLGLKLQPAKGPVPMLVIDHAEPATEN